MPYKDPNDPRQKEQARKSYLKYRDKYLASARARNKRERTKNRAWINSLKEKTPCTDCGKIFPAVCMDFDHLDPSIKVATVSSMVRWSERALKKEIEKCEIVCSNCHRIRTRDR